MTPSETEVSGSSIQLDSDTSGRSYRFLPKYLSYKAAALKERRNLIVANIVCASLLGLLFVTSRFEVHSLQSRLREKEFILAPGVVDFTPASPLNVSDRYVADAAADFLADLGNVTSNSIDEQYQRLTRFMSKDLKVKFEMETADWIEQVKSEGIAQVMTVKEKQVKADGKGNYKVTALARADFYVNRQYLGFEDQAIEMEMHLIPPKEGQRWYLEMEKLQWTRADTFQMKAKLQEKRGGN